MYQTVAAATTDPLISSPPSPQPPSPRNPQTPRARLPAADRDLLVEATIIDIREITAPPPRDPLRGLRRAVSMHAAAAAAAAAAATPPSPSPPSSVASSPRSATNDDMNFSNDGLFTANFNDSHRAAADPVSDLAEALAEVLEGTGARVAVRSPHGGARGAAGRAAGPDAFVLRGRFVVIKGPADDGDEGERAAMALCLHDAIHITPPLPHPSIPRGPNTNHSPLHPHPHNPILTPTGIIVDPSFRETFRIAPATPGYARLVEALPDTFIGAPAALRRLVALVTAQAARSYAARGLTPPPWRRYGAMVARWAPPRARYTDTPVSPPASPLARLGSGQAAALARAAAGAAASGAFARLAAAAAPAPPARVVRGFEVGLVGGGALAAAAF
jgi:hypothetical protein